jgi:DNA polymerase III epsilon subunit-like protein
MQFLPRHLRSSTGQSMNLANNPAVVIDVETSGVNPFRNDVLAVGLVPLSSDSPPASSMCQSA